MKHPVVAPYTDAEIDAMLAGEHHEILPNCPTCKWLVTVEMLREEIAALRSCASGAMLDDYRACLAILNDYVVGGGTLEIRLRTALDGLKARLEAKEGT